MFGYIQFAEDYFPIIVTICRSLKRQLPDIQFGGIAIRRSTICAKVDSVAAELKITSYDWWNAIEQRILDAPYDPEMMRHYREMYGSENLRFIIDGDRDFSPGYVSGAITCGSRFGERVNQNDETRWKYVIGMIDYFTRSFEAKRPDFIFLNEITFAWEIAMSIVAGKMNIPCLSLAYMRGCRGYCITDDVYGEVPQANDLYRRSLSDPSLLTPFMAEAQKMIEEFRTRPATPDYMKNAKNNFRKKTTYPGMVRRLGNDLAIITALKLKLYGTGGVLRQCDGYNWLKQGLRLHLTGRQAINNKLFESAQPYLAQDYIFYPLHYEPESSTSVASHKLTNQLAVIEQISKNIPFGFRLLVKEHWPSLGLRPPNFYERIKAIPDVHLISPFENPFMLEKNARLIIVLTGSAGWEGIMLGTPVMVFGHADYTGIGTGFRQCENIVNFASDIRKAMEVPPATDHELTHFIAAQIAMKTDLTSTEMAEKFDNRKHDSEKAAIYGKQLSDQILAIVRNYQNKD